MVLKRRGELPLPVCYRNQWLLEAWKMDNDYVAMASLDLSMAFEIVDVKLEKFAILGLPGEMINLIKMWVSEQYSDIWIQFMELANLTLLPSHMILQ